MSLAKHIEEQIEELEDELQLYQSENKELKDALNSADGRIEDLEHDCADMGLFIEYIDSTHPELRTAYEAIKTLEGANR